VAHSLNLVDAGYNSVATPVYSSVVTIDKTAPTATVTIGDGTAQRSRIADLTVTFSEVITFVGTPEAAFTLERTVGGVPTGSVTFFVDTTTVAGHTVATIHFTSDTQFGSLTDGHYRLTVLASQVGDTAGNFMATNTVQDFHRFFGDVNGDQFVNGIGRRCQLSELLGLQRRRRHQRLRPRPIPHAVRDGVAVRL
jgi:hypothetical protein